MSKELVISAMPHETRVAILEDGHLCEIYIEREKEFALVGSIYKGRVTRVLPGMQSAFVDIGRDTDAFLYVSDFLENLEEYDAAPAPPAEDKSPKPAVSVARAPQQQTPPPVQEPASEAAAPDLSSFGEFVAGPAAGGAPASDAPGDAMQAGEEEAEQPQPLDNGTPGLNPPAQSRPHQQGGFGRDRNRNFRSGGGSNRDRGAGRGGRFRRGGRPDNRRQGRDLPQSKYASPHGQQYGSAPARYSESQSPAPAGENYEPILLPGESLAKYKERRPSAPVTPASSPVGSETTHEHVEAGLAAGSPVEAEDMTLRSDSHALPASLYAQPVSKAPIMQEHRDEDAPHGEAASAVIPAEEELDEIAAEAETPTAEHGEKPGASAALRHDLSAEQAHTLAEHLTEAKHEETADEAGDEEPRAVGGAEFPEENGERAGGEVIEIHGVIEDAVEEDAAIDEDEAAHQAAEEDAQDEAEEAHESAEDAGDEADAAHEAAEAGLEEAETAVAAAGDHEGLSPAPQQQEPRSARVDDRRQPRFQRPMRRGRGGRPVRHGRPQHHAPQRRPQLISEMLKAGQEIIVQIAKEPLGKKGARITSHVALPGRFLVYMPTVDHIGVSRKISSAEERSRLRRLVGEYKGSFPGGFIVRTAAGHVSDDDVRADIEFLGKTWHEICARSEQRKAPALLHRDLNLVERILRDYLSPEYGSIWIDNEEEFGKVVEFVSRFQPELAGRVKLYTKEAPIFEEFGIQQELDKALRPKVWLKSGGYIVINHTEALVAIDVNTGKFVGRGSTRLEDTIVKTNLEAVKEIVRQIRLRDLGGIIVVDLIDMEERRNREKVMHALDDALRADKAPSKVLPFNEFGLVNITRKRTKQALEKVLCQPCPYCTGSGMVKSIPTICYEIHVEAKKMAADLDSQSLTLRVNPEIAKALKTRESGLIEELETVTKKNTIIQADPTLHWEQYDIF
jgi:ribonuclease G